MKYIVSQYLRCCFWYFLCCEINQLSSAKTYYLSTVALFFVIYLQLNYKYIDSNIATRPDME